MEVNAILQLEKDEVEYQVTAFAKVLNAFFQEDVYRYRDNEDALIEKLLVLENVDFHLSPTGKVVTNMVAHAHDGHNNVLAASNAKSLLLLLADEDLSPRVRLYEITWTLKTFHTRFLCSVLPYNI